MEEGVDGSYEVMCKERHFVSLAENGIGSLSKGAMDRGVMALIDFDNKMKDYNVSQCKVVGTSALRSATNSKDFLHRIKKEVGLDIEVISGDREAALIYKGVSRLIVPSDYHQMIIDVGGGSVEFILFHDEVLSWAQSFDIGIGVLYNLIDLSDPCTVEEIDRIGQYLDDELKSLVTAIDGLDIRSLIGASGSFEVIKTMRGEEVLSDELSIVSISDYRSIAGKLIASTEDCRSQMVGLPSTRVKLIVVTMILIDKAIEIIAPDELLVSPYALKEGLLSELMGYK